MAKMFKLLISSLLIISTLGCFFKNENKYGNSDGEIGFEEVEETKQAIWEQYKKTQKNNSVRIQEFQNKKINYNGKSMRYYYTKVGTKPIKGYSLYIALHGGGSTSASVNDSQWNHMKSYYLNSVKEGIYLAPRGITNTWNLHFVSESFPMYDRLIENMILFEDVNPNKVYIMGFSAGGDGVYNISPKMADRFAGANMSAGHPNNINLKNIYNLPLLLQVGEVDSSYDRNKQVAIYYDKLQQLQSQYPDDYVFDAFIHYNKPHNFYDNLASMQAQNVISNPIAWLNNNNRSYTGKNTNAVAWLKKYTRNPYPDKVIWDITTRAKRDGIDPNRGQQHYWLDIGENTKETLGVNEIIVHLEKQSNRVVVEKPSPYLIVLLNNSMLSFDFPIEVHVENQIFEIDLVPNKNTMKKTINDRGDFYYMFEAAILIEKINNKWVVSQTYQ